MKAVAWALVAAFVGMCAMLIWSFTARADYNDECAKAGGVAVESRYGPTVCIDRDALIDTD